MERRTVTLCWAALVIGIAALVFAALELESVVEAAIRAREPVGRWTEYLAPESVCPGSSDPEAPPARQEQSMLCLIDWARRRAGLAPLPASQLLMRSALLKTIDIARCREFSHEACGKRVEDAFDRVGYRSSAASSGVGENIAWGAAAAGSPRNVLNGWLNSPAHRENIFLGQWTEQGIALLPLGIFAGAEDVNVWTSHFGYRR